MHIDDLTIFRESLARAAAQDGFIDSFYDHFMAQSPKIPVIFANRDMVQIKRKLMKTLQIVADTAEGPPGIGLYMELLGRIHHRLNVDETHFQIWQTALLDTLEKFDAQYDARVRLAWKRVIDSVVAKMFLAHREHHKQVS